MNYIKQNHLSILIILWLVLSTVLGGSSVGVFGANRETSTITNPFNFTQGLTSASLTTTGAVSFTGTVITDEFTQGGSVLSTSTSATATTLDVSDLLTYSVWEVTPNVADLTYTFPAVASLATLVPTAGDSRTWTIINATTTAGIDVIFAAGSGSAIKGVLLLDEASQGTIQLTRKANGDIVILTNFPIAD